MGRAEEFGLLAGIVGQIGDPAAPTCVAVTGEAGVGKSRLLLALADHASAGGVRVLRGACLELSEALPYSPFVDVLDQLAADDGAHTVRELAGGWVGGLDAVLPVVGPGGADAGDVTGAQQRLFQAVATVLIAVARQRPTMLLIEDLQWADQSTLDLLTFVVYRAGGARLLIAVTVRDEGMQDDDPAFVVLASLRRSRRLTTLPLSRLDRHGVAELVSRIRGGVAGDAAVARIHELTGGNPFLVEELLAAGDLDDERVVTTLRHQLLGHRLARLGSSARRLVRLAAVGGAHVDQDLLVRVAGTGGRNGNGGAASLREAVDAGLLLIADHQVRFRHALLGEAVLSSLSAQQRATLHADWAATLAEAPGAEPDRPARLAHHWAAAGEPDKAFPAMLEAAAVAERLPAHAEASRLLEGALDLWDRCPDTVRALGLERRDVLERAVTSADVAGRDVVAARRLRETIQRVEATAGASTLGNMHARLAMLLLHSPAEAIAACERARQLVPADPPSAARAYVLTQETMVRHILRAPAAVDVGQEAIDAARQIGEPQLEAAALVAWGTRVFETGRMDVEAGVRRLERALAIAAQHDDAETQGRAFIQLSWLLIIAGWLDRAYQVARDGVHWAQRTGHQQTEGAVILPNAVWAAFLLGRWDDAAGLLALPGWEHDRVLDERASRTAELAVARGDFPRVEGLLRPAEQSVMRTAESNDIIVLGKVRAEFHLWMRQPTTAIDTIDAVLASALGLDDPDPGMLLASVGLRACADLRAARTVRRCGAARVGGRTSDDSAGRGRPSGG